MITSDKKILSWCQECRSNYWRDEGGLKGPSETGGTFTLKVFASPPSSYGKAE